MILTIDEIKEKISLISDVNKIKIYKSVIEAYKDNLNNDLWCCDFVVTKIF